MAYLGYEAALLYGVGVAGSPPTTPAGLAEINVQDLDFGQTADEAEKTGRADNGFKTYIAGAKDYDITFNINWDGGAAAKALEAAWRDGGILAMAVLTAKPGTAGSRGLVGNFVITQFTQSQTYGEVQKVDVAIKLNEFGAWWVKS